MPGIVSIWKSNICASSGAIGGGIVGLLFGLAQLGSPGVVLPITPSIETAILLGIIAWVAVVVIIGLWLHYGAGVIALPALISSLITAIFTVLISNQVNLPVLDTWIGLIVGTLVGAFLCRLCGKRPVTSGDVTHGMR